MVENIEVTPDEDGIRLDKWLKQKFPDMHFSVFQKAMRTGQLRVDSKRAKGDKRLEAGQKIRIPPQLSNPVEKKQTGISKRDEEFIQSLVIYKDKYIIAINKPAGLATQGGSKINKHVDGLLDGLMFDTEQRPRLVHRLDKDTSGVLVLARNAKAAKFMGDVFRGRDVRKYYWAITIPVPIRHKGIIETTIGNIEDEDGVEKMRKTSDDKGKLATTYYSVIEALGKKVAWVAFWPRTGRKHQIRVHAQEIDCPLLGDYKYGYKKDLLEHEIIDLPDLPDMLHLHARRIMFRHPITNERIDIVAPLDSKMKKTWDYFNFDPNDKTDPFEDID